MKTKNTLILQDEILDTPKTSESVNIENLANQRALVRADLEAVRKEQAEKKQGDQSLARSSESRDQPPSNRAKSEMPQVIYADD